MPQHSNPEATPRVFDVVVVGAGLAGLTAAAFAARGGARVVLVDRAGAVGGRAATQDRDGYLFNVGPHALYDGGPASRALAELGVSFSGRRPPVSGGLALHRGKLHALPGGFVSLLTTDLLSLGGKLEFGRALGSLAAIDAPSLRGQTLRQWLDTSFRDEVAKGVVEALMRLTAYANNPSASCAAAAVAQLQHGLARGVLYLDGGWATLTKGLRAAAEAAGATVVTARRVRRVRATNGGFEVDLDGPRQSSGDTTEVDYQDHGTAGDSSWMAFDAVASLRARTVVLAVPPAAAAGLVDGSGGESIRRVTDGLHPVKAACLDLGLRRLPEPRRPFVIGIDQPLYFSAHSASARLAPDGGALVHVAKYLGAEPEDPKAVEKELEDFCDLVQPGWRDHVAARRYLPSMLVTGALVCAERPRPAMEVADVPGLLLAGDWIGDEGMIADAAVASGRRAGVEAASRARSGLAGIAA